ncbi:SIS domain-containing protein [Ideonella sp. BN130291]|uniref:SIS domain-containing protein n=1 Tax=Ideonella sp. BN130291 TaxID=3112940 RepID=UPI002E25C2E1|nr:SIS domain-containing protein [Ideonella sp. BN130291]
MLEQRIQQQFFDSADLKYQAAEALTRPIADAAQAVLGCITAGGKLLLCGTGASAAQAQHVAAQFMGRFERERPGLAALALSADSAVLTSVADEGDYAQIFAKQVRALGNPGDLLLVLSHQGGSPTLLTAVDAAHEQDMTVIAFTGNGGGLLGARLAETDVHICVPHERAVRIQEVHSLALHCICDAVDLQLLGEQDNA